MLTIWDGDSENRDSDDAPQKRPNHQDWHRLVSEMSTLQTRVDDNDAGRDDDTLHTVGTKGVKSGMVITEEGDGAVHKTTFTFTDMSLASVIGTNDRPYGSQALYTFPDGHIVVLGTHIQFPATKIACVTGGGLGFAEAANIEVGVGNAATTDTSDNGLNGGTEEAVVAALDIDLTSKTSDAIETAVNGTAAIVDGHGSGKTYYLNYRCIGAGDHGVAADALLFSGVFTILWSNLGDNA